VEKSGVLKHKSGNVFDKAHRAVIFEIAQLSYLYSYYSPVRTLYNGRASVLPLSQCKSHSLPTFTLTGIAPNQ